MISMRALRAFRSMMEVGSVAGAGDRIGRTHAQASRLLTQLEQELGFELFIRERQRLVPTERAHQFYAEAKRTLDNVAQLEFYGEMLRQERHAYLRIFAPPYAAYTVLPQALARFREAYPEGRFSVELVTSRAIESWIPAHRFHLGIASLPFDGPSVEVKPLAQVPTVVAMPVQHPLAKKDVITLDDLASEPFIALNKFTRIRRQLDEICQRNKAQLNIVGEAGTGLAALALVAEGLGLTIIDRIWLDVAPKDKLAWRHWLPGHTSEYGLIRPTNTPLSEQAVFLSSALSEIFVSRFGTGRLESPGGSVDGHVRTGEDAHSDRPRPAAPRSGAKKTPRSERGRRSSS
jgi:DNA-binding transcriptional LysR family regulator